jgi:hypothetical protein
VFLQNVCMKLRRKRSLGGQERTWKGKIKIDLDFRL